MLRACPRHHHHRRDSVIFSGKWKGFPCSSVRSAMACSINEIVYDASQARNSFYPSLCSALPGARRRRCRHRLGWMGSAVSRLHKKGCIDGILDSAVQCFMHIRALWMEHRVDQSCQKCVVKRATTVCRRRESRYLAVGLLISFLNARAEPPD